MIWLLIITAFNVTPLGLADARIIVEPARYKSEAECKARISDIARRLDAATRNGESPPPMALACRGIDFGARV